MAGAAQGGVGRHAAGVAYPPTRVVLVGFKDEKRLDVYAGGSDGKLARVMSCPVLAASGKLGPKLRNGDGQVPEGVYAVESLNPNSGMHVALRLGYPNETDRALAAREGRTDLGTDVMIHGGAASVGCLAVGDPASEDLFVLAAAAGIEHVTVVISPVDLRIKLLPAELAGPRFAERYRVIREELSKCRSGSE